jgi:hypothetical protein
MNILLCTFSPLNYLYRMIGEFQIPEPFLFNPMKHHLGYIREYIYQMAETEAIPEREMLLKDLRHLGTSVMDVYTGSLLIKSICNEAHEFLEREVLTTRELFAEWAGIGKDDFRLISLSDGSEWTLKYYELNRRFVHIFPARGSEYSFRAKSNTMKSALLYSILIGKDFITGEDLNRVRPILGLSPVKNASDARAITDLIEILRENRL